MYAHVLMKKAVIVLELGLEKDTDLVVWKNATKPTWGELGAGPAVLGLG